MSFTARHVTSSRFHIADVLSWRTIFLETAFAAGHLSGAVLLRHTVAHTHTALLTGHLSASASHWATPIRALASHCPAAISTGALHCPTPVGALSGHLLTLPPAETHLPHHSALCPLMPSVEFYEFPHFFSAFLHFVDDFAHFFSVVGLIGLDQLVQKAIVWAELFAGSCLFSRCLFHYLFRGEYRYCYQ